MSEREKLKVSTRAIYDEFVRQNVPVRIVDAKFSMLEYIDTSEQAHNIFSVISDKSSAAGHLIGNNKLRTEVIAKQLDIPTPLGITSSSVGEALEFLHLHKHVVVKPIDNDGGGGVSTGIRDEKMLRVACDYALEYGSSFIAQQHVTGSDIRLLIVAGKFRSAVERRPAHVIGDGISTVRTLIEAANASGERELDSMKSLGLINAASASHFLQEKIESVPMLNESVSVIGPANLSLGGTAHEATGIVTQEMIQDAEKIAQKLELAICGVDMMWNKTTNSYALIEINATPGINMHNDPFWGTSSDAVEHYVRWLIDPDSSMRTFLKKTSS